MQAHRPRSLLRIPALLVLTLTLALGSGFFASCAFAQKIRPDFWGLHDNDWTNPPTVPVGSANLTTTGVFWTSIEPTKGNYDWTLLTAQVNAAEAIHAQPMILLGRTPQFYSSRPDSPDYNKYMPDLGAWRRYVGAVAAKFGTRLDYQIWPEPNIPQNWLGTPREMAQLTAAASKAIKAKAGKNAKVVAPALPIRLKGERKWAIKYYKQSVGGKRVAQYVDVVAIDPYPMEDGTPEDSYQLTQSFKKQLAHIGVRKPIWSNEINYGVVGGYRPVTRDYSVDEQQSYVVRTYALSAAARMQRTYWLAWIPVPDVAIDMTDSDGQSLPPAESYEVVRSWLNGTQFGGCAKAKSGLWVCSARKGTEIRRIYWDPKGKTTIKTPGTSLRLEDQEGDIDTRAGSRRIRVDFRPIMVASRR